MSELLPAAAGALMAGTGLALGVVSWPRRRASDTHHLLFAVGFFLVCAGLVGLLAGVGIYH